METTEHGIQDSRDVANVYHLRLMTLLQELVRDKGHHGAARVLEIDQQTVTESARTGQLTRRVRQALERALQEGVGSAGGPAAGAQRPVGGTAAGVGGRTRGVGQGGPAAALGSRGPGWQLARE